MRSAVTSYTAVMQGSVGRFRVGGLEASGGRVAPQLRARDRGEDLPPHGVTSVLSALRGDD